MSARRLKAIHVCACCGANYRPHAKESRFCSLKCAGSENLGHPIHGLCNTPEHSVWGGIKTRCYNPNATGYENYGGRGITMCAQWLNDFSQFYKDMGPRPSSNHSIERKDTNGNYDPTNCVWATSMEQGKNRRNNRPLTLNGETLILSEWARRLGFSTARIVTRLKRGWSVEKTLTTPLKQCKTSA